LDDPFPAFNGEAGWTVASIPAIGEWPGEQTLQAISGFLERAVAYARRRPAAVLTWLLGLHLVVWTLVPMLVSANLQLDLAEDLALGREWQLGYWKHPPLPWWLADLAYHIVGHVNVVYVLGPLAVVICFYAVWLLAREIVGEFEGLIAVVALEAIHLYNFSAVKFAHDQLQLPFWALTGLFFWRAIVRGRTLDWILAGVFLAGAFWSKYAVFALAATLGLVLLLDPFARRSWRTPGPYVMAIVFVVIVAPNVWWLVQNDFLPLRYVDSRAVAVAHWYQYLVFPLAWIGGQALYLLPALALLAFLYLPRRSTARPAPGERAAFNRRYVAALALGPFAVTTVIAAVLGRQPIALWGYPLWSFLPLALVVLMPPAFDLAHLRRFAAAAIAALVAVPAAFVAAELGEPLIRDRPKATQFPGRTLAETITRTWRERTGRPLAYVGGALLYKKEDGTWREVPGAGQFAANNVAVYSPDRPRVVVNGELKLSPWIDPADLDRRGAVLVWQWPENVLPENLKRAFPRAELQPPVVLKRHTLVPRRPEVVNYAIVPPNP
jgi:4-amino-4-deoxy-L-arabinose transferase-like glycosyltransferase